jgi:hypothetical protein
MLRLRMMEVSGVVAEENPHKVDKGRQGDATKTEQQ